jgi:hypothetical protein
VSLLDSLAAALGPVVRQLAADLGCEVAIYRAVMGGAADGTPTRTYPAVDAAWPAARAFFEPGSEGASTPTEAIAKPFGVRTTAFGTLTFVADDLGALPIVSPFDGFRILTGPFAGYTWLAQADHVPDPLGTTGAVRVVSAPSGVIT